MNRIYILYILIFFCFWFVAALGIDPDFGWHIRFGELVLYKGIPFSDPFSYSMPSYQFINHEWLTDIAIAWLYPYIGYIGLAGLFAFIATAALALPLLPMNKRWLPFPLILLVTVLLPFVGVRPQLITWLFLSGLFYFFQINTLGKRKLIIPPLFLLWANMHGGFLIGLVAFCLFLLARSLNTKRIVASDWVVFIMSTLLTLINPYGINLWQEIWVSAVDPELRFLISEWIPLYANAISISLCVFVAFSLLFIYRYHSRFTLAEKLLFLAFFCAGVISIRHLVFWLLFTVPLLIRGFIYLFAEIKKIPQAPERFSKGFTLLTIIALLLFVETFFRVTTDVRERQETYYYPQKAVIFLSNNLPHGNILSHYNWGGYLNWKLPQKKVFIDGRMPSWKNLSAPSTESRQAFAEYHKILRGEISLESVSKKYAIDTILLPYSPQWDAPLKRTKKNTKLTLPEQILSSDWEEVYRDNVSIIFQKDNL